MERKPSEATERDVMSEKPGSEHSLIESFFKEMTVEQFQLMASSEPDGATKTRLAELLLELVACGSRAVVKNLDHGVVVVMEENVRSIVGDPILFSFGALMKDLDQVQCEEVDLLRTLLFEEFVKKVNAILQNIMFSERIASQGPAPHRLNTMIDLTCHLFSVFRTRTLRLMQFRRSYQKNRVTEDIQPVRSGRRDVAAAIFVIISKQAEKISAPLLNHVQDWERSQLKSQTSLEIQKISDKMSLRHRRVASERGAGKIEVFLSVHFIRALLYHIMEQIHTKFHLDRGLQSLPLFSVTDTLLGQVTDGGEEHIDYVNEFWSLKNVFSGKDQDFVFELFHVICRCTAPHKSDAEICEEAWHKVQYFMGLTSWWLNTQAMKQGAEVRLAMKGIELQRPGATRGTMGLLMNSEGRQTLVWILLVKVISKAIKGARGSRDSNVENIVTRLLEKTWVEVKDFHFEFTSRSFGLHRPIYADLLKKFGSAQMMLVALQRTDSCTEREFVFTVAYHLTRPKPKGMMHRFFSFMGKEARKLFILTKRKLVLIMSTVCKGQ